MWEITRDLTSLIAQYVRERPNLRKYLYALSAILIICGLFGASFFEFSAPADMRDRFTPLFVFGIFLGIYITGVLIFSSVEHRASTQELELEPIRKERITIENKIGNSEPDIFDTIRLNLNQLNEYYIINKNQAKNSFRASMMAIIIGLATIFAGIWFFYLSDNPNKNLTYLTIVGGVILQFVGGAYFYLHNKSIQQLNFFFQRLITTQDTMLSIGLVDRVPDNTRKAHIYEQLIHTIINRETKDIGFIGGGKKTSSQKNPSKKITGSKPRAESLGSPSSQPATNIENT
jgi:hypothetical protein